ncbi:MAG: DUF6249 domain-containing protein [Mediterranea sp.]|nr:DUF6249 domain-containing protein [Mediterranea sp.]
MKRIILLFIAIVAGLVIVAQTDTSVIRKPAMTDTQIEYTDTPADPDYTGSRKSNTQESFSSGIPFDFNAVVPIMALICVFGMPVFIVFIVSYFKHKNKKAKYKLVEQALAAGQPIPQEFLDAKAESSIQQKGITNIFMGIGLFIFLWALTEEFSIGCIGLLVMFMGFGQVVIHYTGNKKKETKKPDNKDNTAAGE